MYAVIKSGGKQYKVREGDTLEVERLATSVHRESRGGRGRGRGGRRRDRRREELFEFEQPARRHHMFVRGDAGHGRLMHPDGVGDVAHGLRHGLLVVVDLLEQIGLLQGSEGHGDLSRVAHGTAAHADHYVRIRPGSDLAFTGDGLSAVPGLVATRTLGRLRLDAQVGYLDRKSVV